MCRVICNCTIRQFPIFAQLFHKFEHEIKWCDLKPFFKCVEEKIFAIFVSGCVFGSNAHAETPCQPKRQLFWMIVLKVESNESLMNCCNRWHWDKCCLQMELFVHETRNAQTCSACDLSLLQHDSVCKQSFLLWTAEFVNIEKKKHVLLVGNTELLVMKNWHAWEKKMICICQFFQMTRCPFVTVQTKKNHMIHSHWLKLFKKMFTFDICLNLSAPLRTTKRVRRQNLNLLCFWDQVDPFPSCKT